MRILIGLLILICFIASLSAVNNGEKKYSVEIGEKIFVLGSYKLSFKMATCFKFKDGSMCGDNESSSNCVNQQQFNEDQYLDLVMLKKSMFPRNYFK